MDGGARVKLTRDEAAATLSQYRAMVWHIAKKAHRLFPNVELDELAGEVQLAFVEACHTFNAAGPAPVGLYLRKAGWRGAMAFCRRERFAGMATPVKARRDFAIKPATVVSLDAPVRGGEGGAESLADAIAQPVQSSPAPADQDAWWADAMARLTERQRTVVHMRYREGLKQTEIADRLGVSQAAVCKVLSAAVRMVRQPPANRNQNPERRGSVAELLRARGALGATEIAKSLRIPVGTIAGVLNCPQFKKTGNGKGARYALVAA